MAGSYEGARLGPILALENLGDAAEAIHEMLWLIERTIGRNEAIRLLNAEYYPIRRKELPRR